MEYSADIATAKQLVYAYQEAPTPADEEYAAQEINGFLDALSASTGTPVLIALLGVPSTELTQPVLDEVGSRLAERGPAAVRDLLRLAVLGDDPVRANALAVLDQVDTRDLADGLVGVLKSDDQDELKEVAARSLLALGPEAGAQVSIALRDPEAGPFITLARSYGPTGTDADALAAQRADRDTTGAGAEDDMGVGNAGDEALTSASGNGRGAAVGPEDEAPDTSGGALDADDALDVAPDDADADAGLGFATDESGDEGYLDAAPDDAGEDEIEQIGQLDDVESAAVDETSDIAADDPSQGDVEDAASQLERDFQAYKQYLDEASGSGGASGSDETTGGGEA